MYEVVVYVLQGRRVQTYTLRNLADAIEAFKARRSLIRAMRKHGVRGNVYVESPYLTVSSSMSNLLDREIEDMLLVPIA